MIWQIMTIFEIFRSLPGIRRLRHRLHLPSITTDGENSCRLPLDEAAMNLPHLCPHPSQLPWRGTHPPPRRTRQDRAVHIRVGH